MACRPACLQLIFLFFCSAGKNNGIMIGFSTAAVYSNLITSFITTITTAIFSRASSFAVSFFYLNNLLTTIQFD